MRLTCSCRNDLAQWQATKKWLRAAILARIDSRLPKRALKSAEKNLAPNRIGARRIETIKPPIGSGYKILVFFCNSAAHGERKNACCGGRIECSRNGTPCC